MGYYFFKGLFSPEAFILCRHIGSSMIHDTKTALSAESSSPLHMGNHAIYTPRWVIVGFCSLLRTLWPSSTSTDSLRISSPPRSSGPPVGRIFVVPFFPCRVWFFLAETTATMLIRFSARDIPLSWAMSCFSLFLLTVERALGPGEIRN